MEFSKRPSSLSSEVELGKVPLLKPEKKASVVAVVLV